MPLKAEKVDDRWYVQGESRQMFKEIVGAIGYGDAAAAGDYRLDAMVVVGLHDDGRFIVIEEAIDWPYRLTQTAVDLKDRFLLRDILLDGSLEWKRQLLRITDGLCDYARDPVEKQKPTRPIYKASPETWEHFRDRKTKAILLPVSEEILSEIPTAISKVYALIEAQTMVVADHCVKTKLLSREPSFGGQYHPLLLALVFAVMTLFRRHQHDDSFKAEREADTWYPGRWIK